MTTLNLELRIKILFGNRTVQSIFTVILEQEERIKRKIYEAFVMNTQLSFISFISNGKHFHAQDLSAKC